MTTDIEKQQQLESVIKDGKIIDVPDYILDMAALRAKEYFNNSQERLLGAYSEEAKETIKAISTHQKVDSSERRELHREIIMDMIGGKKVPEDGQQNIYLFAGPPGAGKSTLRKKMESGEPLGENHPLEALREQFKEDAKSAVSVDFGIFKAKLPEYSESNDKHKQEYGDMYAVIRSEASGLNEAILQMAKDAKLPSIREQLMDIDIAKNKNVRQELEGSNLTVIGVTTSDPETIRKRVQERENPMKDEEVVRAIRTFSKPESFETLAKMADKAVLVNTDNEQYKTILTAEKGKTTVHNSRELIKFRKNEDYGKQTDFVELVSRSSGRDLKTEHLYGV